MPSVHEICRYLHEVAPLSLAEDWDNVGLLLGDEATDVVRVLTCLTLTPDVAEDAGLVGARLIVKHHPVLFNPAKRLVASNSEGRMLLKLMRHGIAVYSPHTAYDNSATGINQQLAELLELEEITSVADLIDRYQLPPKLTHLVLVNGHYIEPDKRATTLLNDGDALAIWPPIAGG